METERQPTLCASAVVSAAAEPMAAIRCNVTCVPLQVSAGEKGAARPCAGCEGYQCRQTGERFWPVAHVLISPAVHHHHHQLVLEQRLVPFLVRDFHVPMRRCVFYTGRVQGVCLDCHNDMSDPMGPS